MTFAMVVIVGGRLLPTLMYINTLQMVVYTPLVTTNMPSNLHYFLNNYLQLFRLNLQDMKIYQYGEESFKGIEQY